MRHRRTLQFLLALSLTFLAAGRDSQLDENSDLSPDIQSVHADVVATGIPGAGAIAQIGTFHKGGPFHDNATFAASTQPGNVLDRTRLFVASSSNFGAPLARAGEAPGSVLSIDVSGGSIAVPPSFASAGGQSSALGGKVILFAAQSPAFLNGNNNPNAVTNDRTSASLPLGISLNDGFGRPWFANAPAGSAGDGTITVIDPSGVPLAGAPDPVAGGVFAGSLTNRAAARKVSRRARWLPRLSASPPTSRPVRYFWRRSPMAASLRSMYRKASMRSRRRDRSCPSPVSVPRPRNLPTRKPSPASG